MSCEDIEGLLAAQVMGDLSEFEREQLERHVAACPACAQARSELALASGALQSLQAVPVPDSLAQRTLDALAEERAAEPSLGLRFRQFLDKLQNMQATPARGVLAAAFGILLFMGLMTIEPHRPPRPATAGPVNCQSNIQALDSAIEQFRQDHEGRPPSELGELIPRYTMAIPNCPQAGFDTYSQGYKLMPEAPEHPYSLECHGDFHGSKSSGNQD